MGRRPAASLTSIALCRPRPRPAASDAGPFEAVAVAAVPSPAARPATRPAVHPADGPTCGPVKETTQGAAEAASAGGDILAFWKALRGERRFPSWTDLRFERCAEDWPNSLLLRIPEESDSALPMIEASFSEVMRAAARRATQLSGSERPRIDHTPVMTEWLIALSQEAARAGRPISDEQLLPSWRGPARYRAIALPFSEDQAEIDHVLCHVAQA